MCGFCAREPKEDAQIGPFLCVNLELEYRCVSLVLDMHTVDYCLLL